LTRLKERSVDNNFIRIRFNFTFWS